MKTQQLRTLDELRRVVFYPFPVRPTAKFDRVFRIGGSQTVVGVRNGRIYASPLTSRAFGAGLGWPGSWRLGVLRALGLISPKLDEALDRVEMDQRAFDHARDAGRALAKLGIPAPKRLRSMLSRAKA